MVMKLWTVLIGAVGLLLAVSLPADAGASSDADRADYIIVFSGRANFGLEQAAIASAGGQVFFTYESALNGVAVSLPKAALNGLKNRPDIASIELDGPVTTQDTQTGATWGLDRIDQRALPLNSSYQYNFAGLYGTSAVDAYIIDTGILSSHVEFTGRVRAGYSSIKDRYGTEDCNGHGTHVSGTVGGTTYGVAKKVRLTPVRVLDCKGSGSWSGVLAGIDWVVSNHQAGVPAVANMSLGGGVSSAVDTAVSNMIADGVVVAVAAGNSNADACASSPARVPGAITVGATTSSDARSSFSNYGTCVDIFAPGNSITSAWNRSKTSTNTISGTSMASPHAAGVAALLLSENQTLSVQSVVDLMMSRATNGVVVGAGTGSPNRLLYSLAS